MKTDSEWINYWRIIYIQLMNNFYKHIKRIVWNRIQTIFFIVTCAIYVSMAVYCTNVSEYKIGFIHYLPIVIIPCICVGTVDYVLRFVFTQEKYIVVYDATLFMLTLGCYIQYNFLNPKFSELNGAKINWDAYKTYYVVSLVVWIAITVISIVSCILWKSLFRKVTNYIALFLSLVQIVSIVVLTLTTSVSREEEYGFTKTEQFNLGSEQNIVVFLIDSCEYTSVQDYLNSADYIPGELDDFTFYYHGTSGGSTTTLGIPVLLTGAEYDPMQSIEEYDTWAWNDVELYDDLHSEGYDIRLSAEMYHTLMSAKGKVDNVARTTYRISDYNRFLKETYKLGVFLVSPQIVKPFVDIDANGILQTVVSDCYQEDDLQFCKDFLEQGLNTNKYKKTFRYYHFWGCHVPGRIDKDFNPIKREAGDYNNYDQMCADFKIIREYISQLKSLGIYDDTMIVICGDHGQYEEDLIQARPAILVKNIGEKHEFIVDGSPISLKNVYASFAQNVLSNYEKYGTAIKDISWDKNIDVLRYQSLGAVKSHNFDESNERRPYDYARYFCTQWEDGGISYEEWNPLKLNRVNDYTLGTVIDFSNRTEEAQSICDQVIVDKTNIVAGDELNVCFSCKLENEKKPHRLYMHADDIIGSQQKMLVYLNGQRIDTHVFTGEEDYYADIPDDVSLNETYVFRFVFPGANTLHQLDETVDDWKIRSITIGKMMLE